MLGPKGERGNEPLQALPIGNTVNLVYFLTYSQAVKNPVHVRFDLK